MQLAELEYQPDEYEKFRLMLQEIVRGSRWGPYAESMSRDLSEEVSFRLALDP